MYQELQLEVVPLTVLYKGENYNEYTEDWLKEMFDGLRSGEKATTAAANPEAWANVIEPVLAGGEDALVLAFSSGLSATYQSAVIAADELQEKYSINEYVEISTCNRKEYYIHNDYIPEP